MDDTASEHIDRALQNSNVIYTHHEKTVQSVSTKILLRLSCLDSCVQIQAVQTLIQRYTKTPTHSLTYLSTSGGSSAENLGHGPMASTWAQPLHPLYRLAYSHYTQAYKGGVGAAPKVHGVQGEATKPLTVWVEHRTVHGARKNKRVTITALHMCFV